MKSDRKKRQTNLDFFLESRFVGVNELFLLVYTNEANNTKRFNARKYYLPKGITINYIVAINGKNIYDHATDSDLKRYKEIRKLTTGKNEYYTTGSLLDYEYIKNYYKLIEVHLSKQK